MNHSLPEATNSLKSPSLSVFDKIKRKLSFYGKRYFIDGMGAMAFGLFASLLVGTILKTIFGFITIAALQQYFAQIIYWTGASSPLVGGAIGVAMAYGLKAKPLVVYTSTVVGGMAYMVNSFDVVTGERIANAISAGPVGVFIAVIVAVEIGTFFQGKTPVDLLVVPITTILSGGAAAVLIGPPIASFMVALGQLIESATLLFPLAMGVTVAILVGMALTAPISSAALCVMLGLSGLAAGAATAGCCAQMIGFAVLSWKENKTNGFLAQGLGTSMLQFPNILRHPQIMIPPLVASAVGGGLATKVFSLTNSSLGAGMGTCGLVGPLLAFQSMTPNQSSPSQQIMTAISILLVCLIIPAIITIVLGTFMRKKGWIIPEYLKLPM